MKTIHGNATGYTYTHRLMSKLSEKGNLQFMLQVAMICQDGSIHWQDEYYSGYKSWGSYASIQTLVSEKIRIGLAHGWEFELV